MTGRKQKKRTGLWSGEKKSIASIDPVSLSKGLFGCECPTNIYLWVTLNDWGMASPLAAEAYAAREKYVGSFFMSLTNSLIYSL